MEKYWKNRETVFRFWVYQLRVWDEKFSAERNTQRVGRNAWDELMFEDSRYNIASGLYSNIIPDLENIG